MEYLIIILITFISGVIGTGIGGVVGAVLNKGSNKIVSLLLSFAAGVMFSVVCFDLMTESVNVMTEATTHTDFAKALIITMAVLIGYLIVWGLNVWIDKRTNNHVGHVDENHPKTADDLDELIHADHYEEHKKENSNLFIAGLVMMFAIALHNLPEGMVIGASYAKSSDLVSELFTGSGFIMAVVIGLHNIPEGMSVSVPLISGGMSKPKSVFLTALSGFPTVIGAILGFALGGLGPIPLVLSLGFASGAMLYVILGELLPEAILMWKSKIPALATIIGIAVGFILVCI